MGCDTVWVATAVFKQFSRLAADDPQNVAPNLIEEVEHWLDFLLTEIDGLLRWGHAILCPLQPSGPCPNSTCRHLFIFRALHAQIICAIVCAPLHSIQQCGGGGGGSSGMKAKSPEDLREVHEGPTEFAKFLVRRHGQ
eukprot:scaffold97292_cov37-Prasinocladus_malaysianus.AAC.1